MKSTYSLYPQVLISTTNKRMLGESKFLLFGFATIIRKEHEGKHYFWNYKRTQLIEPKLKQKALIPFLTSCYKEIYNIIQIRVVSPELLNANHTSEHRVFVPDINTETERERLIKTYNLKV